MEIAVLPAMAMFFEPREAWHGLVAAGAVTLYAIARAIVGDMTIAGNLLFGLFLFLRLARLPTAGEWIRVAQAASLLAAAVVDTLSTDPDSYVFVFFMLGAGVLAIDVVLHLNNLAKDI
jgi:hypothetical protein